jgi:hypothetical protein
MLRNREGDENGNEMMRLCVSLLAISGFLGLTGCGVESEEPLEEPTVGIADTAAAPADVALDSLPFPELQGESELRTYELSLVNRTEAELIVHASAGAGRVVLDTVPGRDSTRVNVEIQARRVTLEAEDVAGRTVRSDTVDLVPAGPNRWEIQPGGR